MFTGIIEEIGVVRNVQRRGSGMVLEIATSLLLDDLKVDQSVSVNGVCLTATAVSESSFTADAVAETLAKSTLHQVKKNDRVNLERALRFPDRLGGHLVQGHVDGIGVIRNFVHQPQGSTLVVEIPGDLQRYTISKGSIAIDGVSMTIAEKSANLLTVAIIPHTRQSTVLQFKKAGDEVNIEVDLLAKYVEQFLSKQGETKITLDWLKQQGF